jgi:hypothetical protein
MSAATKMNDGAVTTSDVLKAMLTENTGRHFLDSGGAYGRNWERNQLVYFDAQSEGSLHVRIYDRQKHKADWDVTLSVYHFLNQRVRFQPEWQARFDAYVAENDVDGRTSWMELMEGFFESLKASHDVRAPYDGSNSEPFTVNTYNHQSYLSQTLQYTAAMVDDVPLYLIQIHGGCDVRGGYTAPKCFTDGEHSEMGLFGDTQATVACDNCEANWFSDGGAFGYDGGSRDRLHEYAVVDREDTFNGKRVTRPVKGRVYLYEDGRVSCPKCAKGVLKAYGF